MGICSHFGCRVSDAPTPSPTPRLQTGCGVDFFPYTQNSHKYPLKIRRLQASGVGGVEGVGQPICISTIMRTRALCARERLSAKYFRRVLLSRFIVAGAAVNRYAENALASFQIVKARVYEPVAVIFARSLRFSQSFGILQGYLV